MKRSHWLIVLVSTLILLSLIWLAYPTAMGLAGEDGLRGTGERAGLAETIDPPASSATLYKTNESPPAETASPVGIMGLLRDKARQMSGEKQLEAARRRALDAGSYRYEAEIRQTLIPRPLPELIGRGDERVNWHAQGEVQLPDHSTTTIWFDGVDPLTLIREGQQTFLKQGDTIKEVQDPTQLVTPSVDFLAYLDAAKNVRQLEPQRAGGMSYTRYAFEIDGPRFAEQVRQQIERELAGELPEGGQIAAPRILQLMTGTGELWVDEAGLPRRQVLDLRFPQATEAYDARVHMVTDFRNYGQPQAVSTVVQGEGGTWQVQEIQPTSGLQPLSQFVPAIPSLRIAPSDIALFLLCWLFALGVICYRRYPRQTYATVTVVVVLVLVGNPLLQSLRWVRFQERQAQAASVETLAEALGLGVVDTTVPATPGQPVSGPAAALNNASSADDPTLDCGDGSPDVDTDQDGLSDFDEGCYGTDYLEVDTDGDTITDTLEILEIQGVDWDSQHRTSNALKADSNRDGLPDGVEWPEPVGEAPGWDPDGDNIPNTWDDDNDGDGVPDSEDLSPFAVGVYRSSLSVQVVDWNRQGYQYIEFQLQPQDPDHLRYTTTWLDWPDNDTEGNVTSRISDAQDLHLVPFLDVETRAIPGAELRTHYGLVLMQESGQTPHLLIPLFAQGSGGAINSFAGKVVYGPGAQPDIQWNEARLVWLVQTVNSDGTTGLAHQYVEDFRLTGMQVTKSDGYELGLFGTPDSALEDEELFNLLIGMSATFLEYKELENQSAGNTVLQEVKQRFDRSDTPLEYKWGVDQRVESSVYTYGHQDQALAESSAQVESYLEAHFARFTELCLDAAGEVFECAGVVVGTEERLRAVPVEELDGPTIQVPMTGVATFASRGLRYQMYQRTGSSWKAVGIARTLEIMEKRYAGQWDDILAGYLTDYPYLVAGDLRFVAHLIYVSWTIGRQGLIEIGDYKFVPPDPQDEEELLDSLGLLEEAFGGLIELGLGLSELHQEINQLRSKWGQPIQGLEPLGPGIEGITHDEFLAVDHELKSQKKKFKILAIAEGTLTAAVLSSSIANVACTATDGCNEDALKYTAKSLEAVEIGFEAFNLYDKIKDAAKQGFKGLKSPWSTMSKGAKALAVAGLVIEIGLIWATFLVTIGTNDWKTSGFVFDLALGTAIVATVFAIVTFVLLMIPGVDIVVGIVLFVFALVDLILWLAGVDLSVMGTILSFFYRAEMVTKVESARYLGGSAAGNALDDADLGFVVGNKYRLWDAFEAIITGSRQANNSYAWATWDGSPTTNAAPFNLNGGMQVVSSSWTRKIVKNRVETGFNLNQAQPNARLKVNTNVHFALRYKKCTLWVICWYDTDHSDTPGNFEVVLDVLPASLTGLWSWDKIKNPDPDGDDLVAEAEAAAGTNPTLWDSDGDGLSDSYERDNRSAFGTDPAQADRDGDGLDDGLEVLWGTFPDDDDSDDDGLLDGEEVAGWEARLPNGPRYWVFSDPLQPDADGDGLNDRMEQGNQTSPYATNVAPRLLVAAAPLSVAPGGKPGTYVQPGTPVQINLGLLNTAGTVVSTTLHICLSNNHLANAQVSQTGVTEGAPPPTQSYDCGSEMTGYQWDFGGHILRVGQAFTTTLTATAAGPSGTGQMTYTLPYQDELLDGVVEVVVDDDNPTASLRPPLEGDILTGEHYVIGGYGDDATTWIEEIDLLIDTDTGPGTAYGPPLAIDHTLGAWGYTWELPADGHYTLATRSRDPFGHESALTQTVIMVDNTPPTVTPELADGSLVRPEEDQMTVTGQATDNLAGLSRVQVSVDGGPWREAALDPAPDPEAGSYPLDATWRYTWTIGAAAQGSHTVAVRALDRVGHMSDVRQVEFVLDAVPPSDDLLTRLYDETPIVAADPDITLTGYANDAGNVPLPPRPAALHGALDAIADATVWLSPASIHEDDAGVSLAWVGDMDGDGRADLAMGLPASENGAGKVVILYGRYGDWQLPPDAESLAEEWTSFVGAEGAGLGAHVAAAGDVDGDGLDDLLLGDPANKRAFLIYGKPYPLGLVLGPNSPLDGPASGRHTMFTLTGDSPLGDFVAPAGDVNGDGYADLLIGSPNAAYLILGHGVPWFASLEASAEAAAVIALPAGGRAMGVGDVDGDQYDDWVVTDPAGGGLHLMSGSPLFTHRKRQALDPASDSLRLAFLPSDGFGATPVAALGDVNGDGLGDFIYSSGDAPALVLGRDSGSWGVSYAFSGFDPAPNGFLAAPGDVDADGKDDLLLGTGDQRAYLILGRADWGAGPEVKATLMGLAGAASAPFAAGADLNCDRSADLLLLPAEAGVGQLLSAARPFGAAPRVKQDALAIETTYEAPSQAAPGLVMAAEIGTMATADTFYVDDDYCASCGNDGHTWGVDAFNNIQEAVNKADNAGDTVVVEPGVYPPFEIGPGKNYLTVRGVNADAVFVDGQSEAYAVHITSTVGISLTQMTLRHAERGVWLEQAGYKGYETPANRTTLDHLLVHDVIHALAMDRQSTALVRRSTLVGSQPDQAIVEVDQETEEDKWEALSAVPAEIKEGGALVRAGETLYALPGGGSNAVYQAIRGLNNPVYAIAMAANGDVYVGGGFNAPPNGDSIARWDGTQWHALGDPLETYRVHSIAVAENDEVYVGGAGGIARWDGTQWYALSSGLSWAVSIAVADNGNVYVGGYFTDAGGVPDADYIARWDGTQWHALGSGLNDRVYAVAVAQNGDVYAGGSFTDAGGVPDADYIARWDGTQWHALGSGPSGTINAIAVAQNGDVYAGGYFTDAGGVPDADGIARWDGTQWHALGSGLGSDYGYVNAIAVAQNGDIYTGGGFSDHRVSASNIARWDHTQWHPVGELGHLWSGSTNTPEPVTANSAVAGDPDGTLWLLSGGSASVPARLDAYNGETWESMTPPPISTWEKARMVSTESDRLNVLFDNGRLFEYREEGYWTERKSLASQTRYTAYVAAGRSGLRIIDVGDPYQPAEVGFYDTPDYASDVIVAGNYAYVADGSSGLHIIDIRNPSAPVEVGSSDTPDLASGVAVAGDYAYVADRFTGLRVINISNSTAPFETGFYDTPANASALAVAGNYAYVADGSSGLRVVDVSNPSYPVEVGFYDTPGTAFDVAVAGNYAYVADHYNGLRVVDVSNPSSPTEVGFWDTPDYSWGVAIAGNYAYLADISGGLRVVDISDPGAPALVGSYDPFNYWYEARKVAVAGDHAYLSFNDNSGGHRLWVVDVSNPSNPQLTASHSIPGEGWAEGVDAVSRTVDFALAWAGGSLYTLQGNQFQRYDPLTDNWTQLADVPAEISIGSGVTMAPDSDTNPRYLTVMVGDSMFSNEKMIRYRLPDGPWDTDLPLPRIGGDKPFEVKFGDGFALEDGYLYLYASPRTTSGSNFFRYGELTPAAITFTGTAFVGPSYGAANWSSLNPAETPDAVVFELDADNAWVAAGTVSPTVQTNWGDQLDFAEADFLDPGYGVYRLGAETQLQAGYYTYHPAAYVSPNYCDGCANDGLAWGVTAFSSIQAAIDSGAGRVLLRPGVYQEAFHLVNGVQVLGSDAEMTIIQPPPGISSGALVTAEGLALVTLGRLTLDGDGRFDGLRMEDGAQAVTVTRNIIRDTETAIVLDGAATQVEIVNNTLVGNANGVVASACAPVDMRNTILSDHSGAALKYQADGCSPPPNHIYRYNAYWRNGHDLEIDGNPAEQPGSGEIRANPRFTSPGPPQHDYRPLDTSPVIDAGNPSDHVPPGTGGRIDIGYLEVGQAVFAVDDDYCETCLNDGLTWGVNAFDNIQAALDAARAMVINLGAALAGPLTVGVGPGSYNERLTVPSHVRLIGTSADEVTLAGENAGTVITLDGVTDVEIRGLRITGSGPSPYAGIRVTGGTREVLIGRNLIAYNDRGIVFEGQATGLVSFNTIVDNTGSGLSASGTGTWAEARNNIVAENVSGFVALSDGQILSDYNLLDNLTNYQGVVAGAEDLQGNPGFVGSGPTSYHLQPDSPAVDAADPAERAPVGGGQQADIGYNELRAVPLTLLFGRQGVSCAEGNSGVDVVDVALVPVADASLAITETLPAGWLPATLETPGQVGSYWSVAIAPDQNGLHRIYSRATDLLQNQESDSVDWYSGAILVDRTPPVVTWLNPAADITTEDIGLRLRATAADWLDTGAGQQFSLAKVHFEVNGEIYSADWADDGWSPASGQPRTFEALVPLPEGLNLIDAVATDRAGHEARSSLQVTSTTAGDAAVITSNYDGSATNQSTLPVSGYARFITSSGSGQVLVQVDDQSPVEATLDDPSATFTAWSATVTLAGEGLHTISATATRIGVTTLDQGVMRIGASKTLNIQLDQTEPELVISTPAEGRLVTETVTLMGSVTDNPGSGVQSIQVSLDGGYSWAEAELTGDVWSFIWLASGAESGVTYVARVRATDKAANTTTQTRSFMVDGEPPQGLAPLTFNIPVGAHLDSVQTLIANWTAAVDGSGQVTVTAAIDQSPDTVPSQVVTALSHSASLNTNGAWYFHLLARDAAGNGIIYHEGPWQVGLNDASVSCDARQKAISLDGHLDVAAREWLTATERLDDDERPGRIQSLYVSWDADFLYLGWEGAQWDMDGTLWAYMDTAPGGSNVSLEGGQTLPFDADVAVEVEGTLEGTLWRNGSPEALEFVAGGNQTEIRVPWNLVSVNPVRLLAYALDDDGQVWSVFPTTNPVAGPWSQAYSWDNPCSITDPSGGQPQGTNVPMTLSSPQEPQAAWGPGNSLEYVVDLTNREARTVTGLQLVFNASAGLAYPTCSGGDTCLLDVPALAPGASHRVNVTGQLASSLGDLTSVTGTTTLMLNDTGLAEAGLSHRVDGQPPSVAVNLPPGNAIGRGLQIVSGTADDGDGSGVMAITIDPANSVNGASFWTAEVDFPDIPDGQVAPFSLAVQAIDARDNRSEVSQVTFNVDAIRPEVLSFTVPLTLSGYYATLPGTARDPAPAGSLVTQVEVQLDDPDSLWQPVNGPFAPDDSGTQAWGFIWALPLEDGVTHSLRARAMDVAGNLSFPSPWQETLVDNIAPLITVTTALTELLTLDQNPVLSGTVSDGSGVSALRVWVEPPYGAPYQEPAELIGDTWRYVLLPRARGVHTLTVEAEDLLGNISQAGPFALMSHLAYLELDTSGHGQLVYEDWPAHLSGITFTTTTDPLTSTATINWGDGAVSGPTEVYTTVSAMHTYADPGVYLVTVSVADPFGLTVSDILTMTVLHGFIRRCAYADSRQPGLTLQSGASLDCPGAPGGYPGQQVPAGASSYGKIHLKDSSTITGPLFSEAGEVVLDREVRLLSDWLALPDGTTMKLSGDLTAEEDVVVGDRSLVAGSITGRATVKLEQDSLVQGDVTAAETVNLHNTATVSGTITEQADIPPLPALTFVEVDLAAGGQDITVEPGEIRPLEPGSYQTLMVKKGGAVQLSTGHYRFAQLKIEQDGQLTFSFDDGGVVVDVVGNLQFGPNVQMSIVSARGDAAGILFQVAGDVIDLKKDGIYLGTFLGPDASIRLEQDALLTGALYGHKVDVMHRAQIIGLPARDLLASRFVNPAISYVPPTRTNAGIVTAAPPVANFSASPISGTVPLTVTLADQSTGDPTSWGWTFGDGGSSTVQHPVYTYTLPGLYTVTLTASNAQGSHSLTRTNYISVTTALPVASFSVRPISGTVPLTVTFTDQSTSNPTSWGWDFGDGGSSTGQHPSHTYLETGSFTVTLTVSNTTGSNTMVDSACINVTVPPEDQQLIYLPLISKNSHSIVTAAPPVASFSASPISGTVPLIITFTDESMGEPTSWGWDFGDGGSSTEQVPSHLYTQPGDYTLTLTVSNDYGSDIMVDPACVNVTAQTGDQRLIYLPLMLKNSP